MTIRIEWVDVALFAWLVLSYVMAFGIGVWTGRGTGDGDAC